MQGINMKRLYILSAFLVLFSACDKNAEFNENNISSEENIVFENISSGLDYQNAGRVSYNKDMQYGALLDVSKEADFEKYFIKYNVDTEYDFTDMPYALRAVEFLEKGAALSDAYKHIAVYYVNRENLGIFDFNDYVLPYNLCS